MPTLADLKEKRRTLGKLIRQAERAKGTTAYDARLERQRGYNAATRAANNELHEIPAVVDAARREKYRNDLRGFLETYFPHVFQIKWSEHHLYLIASIQRAIFEGLQQALGYPRASGKTTICLYSLVWATLYGHRQYVVLFAAEKTKATEQMDSLVNELTDNELLLADFPEVIYPIRSSEGIALKATNQRLQGELTGLEVSSGHLIYPNMPVNVERGNDRRIIKIGSITGASRGALILNRRPDFVLIDDPQTRRAAKSPSTVRTLKELISGDIMGLAGPGKTLSALLTCTVIYKNDLADQYLDRKEHPEWHGIRVKMIKSWPTNMALWDQWSDIVRECQMNELKLTAAHDFYRENREKMDAGAEVYWPDRIIRLFSGVDSRADDFVSALESALFLYFRDPSAFASEYQNEPLDIETDEDMPPVATIRQQIRTYNRLVVPGWADFLTAFVDVQKKILVYAVVAWNKSAFTGHVVDYGSWPDQKRRYFTREDARITIGHQKRGSPWDSCLRNALEQLLLGELGRTYLRDDGVELRIERGLVDANWGDSTDVVYTFLKDFKLAPTWMPSHGVGVRATQRALNDTKFSRRERIRKGVHWRITRHEQYKLERMIFDANWWKSFHCGRWLTLAGDPGSMSLFDRRDHEMFAEHLNAEYGVTAESKGRKVTEWQPRPGNPDNDLLDCMVGCCVGASMLGATVKTIEAMVPRLPTQSRKAITRDNIASFYGG